MIPAGVRAGISGSEGATQSLTGLPRVDQQRLVPGAMLVVGSGLLLALPLHLCQRGVEVQGHPRTAQPLLPDCGPGLGHSGSPLRQNPFVDGVQHPPRGGG